MTDLHRVRANFSEWPKAIIVQGAVPDVLPTLDIDVLAFLHLDMNCAAPERAALELGLAHALKKPVVLVC